MAVDQRFQAFSGQHWLLLAVFAVGVALVSAWGRSHRGTDREQPTSRGYAVVLGAAMVTMQVYYLVEPGHVDLGASLPLELCDLAEYAAVVALWTKSRRATAFTYYVALTLSVQAIVTPSLGQTFPSPRFFGFWTLHFLVVWAAVYLTWGLGFRPTWRLYRFTCLTTLVWAVAAYLVNAALGTDFGYLNRKPSSASLLDLLGPWPWYVVASAAIIVTGWALLLTVPWTLTARGSPGARPWRRGDTPQVSMPTTVSGVIARMRQIDAGLPADDGVGVFNRMYLTVTERIETVIAAPAGDATRFQDPEMMAELDVGFANLWLTAFEADAQGQPVAAAWRPLFEARAAGRLPVQYAVAGMNTHIEHDLPIAVVSTCQARGLQLADVHADYERVNQLLAEVESPIRRSFLNEVGRDVDREVGSVVHALSTWDIDQARDLAWIAAETLWELRRSSWARDRFLEGLDHSVGMTTRLLLTPS